MVNDKTLFPTNVVYTTHDWHDTIDAVRLIYSWPTNWRWRWTSKRLEVPTIDFYRTFTINLTASIVSCQSCVVYTTFVGNSVLSFTTSELKDRFIMGIWWKLISDFFIVRKVCEVREGKRERERGGGERWTWRQHRSAEIDNEFTLSLTQTRTFHFEIRFCQSVTIVALAQNLCSSLLLSQLVTKVALSSRISLPKICTSFLHTSSLKRRDKWWKIQSQTIECTAVLWLLLVEKRIKLIPKPIGNKEEDCPWGLLKHYLRKSADRKAQWFVLCNLQIFSGSVHHLEQTSHTIFFSISNSFWY